MVRPAWIKLERVFSMSDLHSIDTARRLYVIKCDGGITCLGFDVAERRRVAVLRWIGEVDLFQPKGTDEAYNAYCDAMAKGAAYATKTGKRCEAELTAELVGREGKRVEVRIPGQAPHRFYVGRSTGWMPCHLEKARRDSSGGGAVYMPEGATVRTVE
jgi:hypothetical protein